MLAIRTEHTPLRLRPYSEQPLRASIGAKRNPESTRAILEATEAILREKGLAGLSMDEVARRAHCGKPTLYRWWPTKADLLAEVHERALAVAAREGFESIADCVSHWVETWKTTLAGPALRGMIAEAQSSDAAAQVLQTRGLPPYLSDIQATKRHHPQDADVPPLGLLLPLLGGLMVGPLSASDLVPRVSVKAERSPVMRSLNMPEQPPQAAESPPAQQPAIRHRGEWVD